MIRVPDEVKNLFKSDSIHKELEIRIYDNGSELVTIHNDDICRESMELVEAIETGDNLTFTGCIASSFKIETADIVHDIEGLHMEVDLMLPDVEEPVPLFNGDIDTVTNTSHEERTTEIRAYDALYRICNTDVTAWYNSLAFPITIMNMRNSFFQLFGIVQEDDYLPNDSMTVYKTITDAVVEGGTIIRAICQINGRYGRIGRNGKFQYVHLVEGTEAIYPRDDLFPADDLFPHAENAVDNVSKAHYDSVQFENYTVEPINRVQIIGREGNVIATAGEASAIPNVFTLKDNPLVYDKSQSEVNAAAANLYGAIRGLWYTPANISCIGLPYVECGDFVMTGARRSIIRAYVLSRKLTGVQSLKDDYTAKGSRRQPPYTPSIKQQVNANAVAIKNEVSRATGVENNLNTGLGNANNRINEVSADLGRFKQVEAEDIRAARVYADSVGTNTLNAAQIYANQIGSEANRVARGYFDTLNSSKLSTNELSSKISSLNLISFKSMNGNNISCSWISASSSITIAGRNVNNRFDAIEDYISRYGAAMRAHGWSY